MKPPIKVCVCLGRCAGLQCCRCCGDAKLKTREGAAFEGVYDKYCCAKSRIEASILMQQGCPGRAGVTCGLYNPGWLWKKERE